MEIKDVLYNIAMKCMNEENSENIFVSKEELELYIKSFGNNKYTNRTLVLEK